MNFVDFIQLGERDSCRYQSVICKSGPFEIQYNVIASKVAIYMTVASQPQMIEQKCSLYSKGYK